MDAVHAVISGRVTTISQPRTVAEKERYEALRLLWSFHPPGYYFMPKYVSGQWDGRVRLLQYRRVPTGLFRATREEAETKLGIRFVTEREARPAIRFRSVSVSDRPYQRECVAAMKRATNDGGGLILAATGTGKTWIAGMYAQDLRGRMCFVVDELTLLQQSREALAARTGERIGVIGNSEFDPARITVATVQTLHRHRKRPRFHDWAGGVDVVLVDEIHVALNKRQVTVLDALYAVTAVFGLTATLPKRQPERIRAYAMTGPVIYRFRLQEAIEEGYLTAGTVFQIGFTQPPRVRLPWDDPEPVGYWPVYRAAVANSPERNALVEGLVRACLRAGRAVVVLLTLVDHLREMSKRLHDVAHATVYGEVPAADRMRRRREFEAGNLDLILTNRVFKKGVDLRRLDCIVDASAAKSPEECLQGLGRGVRLAPGKKCLLHFDIGDRTGAFVEAMESRRAAFREAGLPVYRVAWEAGLNLDRLVERADELAAREERKHGSEPRGDQ